MQYLLLASAAAIFNSFRSPTTMDSMRASSR